MTRVNEAWWRGDGIDGDWRSCQSNRQVFPNMKGWRMSKTIPEDGGWDPDWLIVHSLRKYEKWNEGNSYKLVSTKWSAAQPHKKLQKYHGKRMKYILMQTFGKSYFCKMYFLRPFWESYACITKLFSQNKFIIWIYFLWHFKVSCMALITTTLKHIECDWFTSLNSNHFLLLSM